MCASIATSAAVGPIEGGRTFAIALRASFWSPRSIVVVTFSPPPNTFFVPYCSTSWSVT